LKQNNQPLATTAATISQRRQKAMATGGDKKTRAPAIKMQKKLLGSWQT